MLQGRKAVGKNAPKTRPEAEVRLVETKPSTMWAEDYEVSLRDEEYVEITLPSGTLVYVYADGQVWGTA